jgi:hypothetical protein
MMQGQRKLEGELYLPSDGARYIKCFAVDPFSVLASANNTLYERLYPYYAEIWALSEIKKKPGFGAEFRSGAGGHCILYLNGVCRDREAGYPTLKLADTDAAAASFCVAVSVNSHYRNANWVAADDKDFIFFGALQPGQPLTRQAYERTQACAKIKGLLDGVEFHERLFRDKPDRMSRSDYMYEISVGTDYALTFGRNAFGARVPLDRQRMTAVIDYLNDLNRPYRDGLATYRWRLFNDNCSHVAHNALAAAGIWPEWPTGEFFLTAAFNFPVPKNEFVDLVLRTNDLPIEDPYVLYRDEAARRLLLERGTLPAGPGGLASAIPAVRANEVYDTSNLRLIFYDNPFWGPYRFRFAHIFSNARYFDLRTNLLYFEERYKAARCGLKLASGPNDNTPAKSGARPRFCEVYERYIEGEIASVKTRLTMLAHSTLADSGWV